MQNNHKRKTVSLQMLGFEFRKVIGNPYVHIFGVGMPVLMMIPVQSDFFIAETTCRSQSGSLALIPVVTASS